MRSRYKFHEEHYPYFITSTVVEWLPIFTTKACCDIIVNALLYGRQHKGLKIFAWVILDNHFHAVVSGPDLSKTFRALKGYTAQVLIDQLKNEKRDGLVNHWPISAPHIRRRANIRCGRRACTRRHLRVRR